MAKLNFPNPSVTQTYTEAGITWTWNDTLKVWSSEAGQVPGGGDVSVDVGDTRPSLPSEGDLWFCTAEAEDGGGRLYVYYDEGPGGTAQWVDVSQPGVGFTQADADDLYLSKTVDDTAAGAITFEGQTTHEAGVSVTGGNLSCPNEVTIQGGGSSTKPILFFKKNTENVQNTINIEGTNTYDQDASTVRTYMSNQKIIVNGGGNYVCYLASVQDGSGNAGGFNHGFLAEDSIQASSTVGSYGFKSNLSSKDGKDNYNFYAAGEAPNYFKGDVIFGPQPNKTDILNGSQNGKFIQRTDANLISARSAVVGNTHASFINPNGVVGYIKTINSNLVIEGLAGGPLLLDADADARKVTSTEEISNASAVVQQLQPVKINGTRHGFTASDLEPVFAEAVSGTAGETQAVGTYTAVDGEVEYDVPEPEAIPLGATWQQTGVRDVYQGVDQTKLIPLLTKALQEALSEIDSLKERLVALEGA